LNDEKAGSARSHIRNRILVLPFLRTRLNVLHNFLKSKKKPRMDYFGAIRGF
jgi:hypothetical protein